MRISTLCGRPAAVSLLTTNDYYYFNVSSHRLSLLDNFDVLLVEVQQGEGVVSLQL